MNLEFYLIPITIFVCSALYGAIAAGFTISLIGDSIHAGEPRGMQVMLLFASWLWLLVVVFYAARCLFRWARGDYEEKS